MARRWRGRWRGCSADPSRRVSVFLAHERAHARRRDPLRLLAVAVLGALYRPATRKLLFADVVLACEEAADEDAARALGDRTLVAEAIVAVERLMGNRAPSGLDPVSLSHSRRSATVTSGLRQIAAATARLGRLEPADVLDDAGFLVVASPSRKLLSCRQESVTVTACAPALAER